MLREPIIDLIYRRKQFDAESAYRTSRVILFMPLGYGHTARLHMLTGILSSKDIITLGKNWTRYALLDLSLIFTHLGIAGGGLALSTAISAIVQIIILTIIFTKGSAIEDRERGYRLDPETGLPR